MKKRLGFVSNSSSSSFVIYRKDPSLSDEEIDAINKKVMNKNNGKRWWEDEMSDEEKADLRKKGTIILMTSVPYGSDEGDGADTICKDLVKALGFNTKEFTFELGEDY